MILTIGCSNGQHFKKSFQNVFGEIEIKDLSYPAFGNEYITGRLFEYVYHMPKPKFVFLQFSGLYRIDVQFDNNFKINEYDFQHKSGFSNWVASGGIRGSWMNNEYTKKHFVNLVDVYSEQKLGHVMNGMKQIFLALELCNKLNIPHAWTTYYDYTNPPNEHIESEEGKIAEWPEFIDMSNKISESPLNFAYEKGQGPDDKVHFSEELLTQFIQKHKDKIKI